MAFTLNTPPLAISVSIIGNIVHLNCFQTVTEDSVKESAHLYGGDIDISVNVMPHHPHDCDLFTHTSGSFFSLVMSHSQVLGEAMLTFQARVGPAVIEQRKKMAESKQSGHISLKPCLPLISNLDYPAAENRGVF